MEGREMRFESEEGRYVATLDAEGERCWWCEAE